MTARLRSFVSVQGSLAMYASSAFGDAAQKKRFLPRTARGECIGCFGLTEPDSGSDPASMKTRARRDGSDYVLSGTKIWIRTLVLGKALSKALAWFARWSALDVGSSGLQKRVAGRKMVFEFELEFRGRGS